MHVCIFEPSHTPFPVVGYGGSERLTELLVTTLLDSGVKVSFICNNVSVFSYKSGDFIQLSIKTIEDLKNGVIPLSRFVPKSTTVFHSSVAHPLACFDFSGLDGIEITTSSHNFHELLISKNLIFLSQAHKKYYLEQFGVSELIKNIFVCYGGVNEDLLSINLDGDHDSLLWIGMLHPVKGVGLAIEIAQKTNQKLLIAGPIRISEFFDNCIKPYLSDQIQYVGEITTKNKSDFFAKGAVYLHTSLNFEPFGLTSVEAQMCGVPVVSFNLGSAYEINYNMNFVATCTNHMKELSLLQLYRKIDPLSLRKWTVKHFGKYEMTKRYLNIWNQLLN